MTRSTKLMQFYIGLNVAEYPCYKWNEYNDKFCDSSIYKNWYKKDVATGKSRLAKDTSSIHADLHCL